MRAVALALVVRHPARVLFYALPVALALVVVPFVLDQYQTILLAYGLVMAIAALVLLVRPAGLFGRA